MDTQAHQAHSSKDTYSLHAERLPPGHTVTKPSKIDDEDSQRQPEGKKKPTRPLWPAAASRQVSEAEGGQDDVLKVRKGRNASQGYSDVTLLKWRNEAT